MKNIKFKYRPYCTGNTYAYANLPTNKIIELRNLLEDGVIPHKDKLWYPSLAYGSVVFWVHKGISPKTAKQVKILGCIDSLINEVSIEYLDNEGGDIDRLDPFKSSRRNPRLTKVPAEELVTCIPEIAPEAVCVPDPDEEDYDIPF